MNPNVQTKNQSTKTPRLLAGKVVSTKMRNTIVVAVDCYFKHKKYGKYITRTTRFKVRDAGNTCHEGEIVYIKEVRPLSKDIRFQLVGKKEGQVVQVEE